MFTRHEESLFHKRAVEAVVNLPATTREVADSLSWQAAETREGNRLCLLQVITFLRFLARQGLTIRGDGRGESHGNFSQLLDLFQRSDDMVKNFLAKKTDKYTYRDVQNDLL